MAAGTGAVPAGAPDITGCATGPCKVMGVLNVTPDSFSDGGRFTHLDLAVRHGLRLWAEGASIVDVGGESTRPGAARVDADEERRRVLPVVRELARAGVPTSIDTTRAAIAEAAVGAGAALVNDVSAGAADPRMAEVVAATGVPWVLTHSRGPSRHMDGAAVYGDIVREVREELRQRVDVALAAGVRTENLVVDPGLGFAKAARHDLALLGHLDSILGLGLPVLVGASRKRFLGQVLAAADGSPRPVEGRGAATVAVSVLAACAGAWGVRVHDVAATVDALRTVDAVRAARRAR